MNFLNVLDELKEQTKTIEVMAIDSYTEGLKDIGIRRRTSFNESMEDPVVDHIPFMICGDIYDVKHERISNINDLYWRIDVGAYVILRAIPNYAPEVVIDLGNYAINSFVEVQNYQYTKAYLLSLERK